MSERSFALDAALFGAGMATGLAVGYCTTVTHKYVVAEAPGGAWDITDCYSPDYDDHDDHCGGDAS